MLSDKATPGTFDALVAVLNTPAAQALRQRLGRPDMRRLSCPAVSSSAQPFFSVLLHQLCPSRPVVVVTEGLKTQESFHQDIQTWLKLAAASTPAPATQPGEAVPVAPDVAALFHPAWETLPHEAKLPHADVISERLETLVALCRRSAAARPGDDAGMRVAPMIVTSLPALLQRTFHPESLRQRTRVLRRGDHLDPLDLVEWLEEQGYEPEVQVSQKGEIALRGGIVDIFPLSSPWPVRLEFFGEELESIRHFDPISQISKENVESVVVPPGGELGLLRRPGVAPELATLLDYLPAGSLFVLCEPEVLSAQAASYAELVPEGDRFFTTWESVQAELNARGMMVIELRESQVETAPGEVTAPGVADALPPLRFGGLEPFRPIVERALDPQIAEVQRREFFAQLHRWSRQGYRVHLVCNNEGERQRFEEIWREYGFSQDSADARTAPVVLSIHLGSLSRGFICEVARLVTVTDAELFGRYKVQRPRRLKSLHAQTTGSLLQIDFTDLGEGDYVVHLQHGIGRYLGLQQVPLAGGNKRLEKAGPRVEGHQECLVIEYAPNDPAQTPPKLYVPVSEAHLVSKYVGAGKASPALNTLGGSRWQKAKDQARHAVRDLAAELLSLQAARASQAGHAFRPDTPWQREFESAFLYEETPDQWKAILATKGDMESARPMDRLICGDVGYGKTEVAIRAAFKAVLDGRQVAVLVPTTVLAQQHFNTFRERMADYPVRVDLLSRFRTAREQKGVIQGLATGSVDIVIGTHRLVQADIAFKDLGLVVIDEEQRFGVLHKERFKLLRKLVDVLTLSATPIPRTLYLALTGARDMSTIETPPQDRLPVETIVCEFDERTIRDAILRELSRGGQVFYLHNRVGDIEQVALRLRALLPKARILVGHGQMDADDLEEVMTRFVNGEADVLLSTTIIESGIDIPNANTIIIDRADRFGLSDLYQLRGRVGRYKHQAYAYLLVPRHARLLTDARKRISAIKQYSTLGSGFKIAMRDLEIRGAGNLLGPQQSGHITAVGFELYCQLLKQSVAVLKGEPIPARIEVQVRLDFLALNPGEEAAERRAPAVAQARRLPDAEGVSVPREVATCVAADTAETRKAARGASAPAPSPRSPAWIPLAYVTDPRQRLEVYRKLAELTDEEGLSRLKAELRDRFGPLPGPVEMLLLVASLKLLAATRGITVLETREEKLMLTRGNDFVMTGGKFPRLIKKEPRARLNEIKRLLQMMSSA